jgi:hypothetical protein
MKTTLRASLAVLLLCAFTACSKQSEHKDYSKVPGGDAHAGHNHSAHAHVHTAPHGGTLVEIGEHAYNLELLRDPATGKLTAWVLDGHAENFVRIKSRTLELVAMPGGKFTPLSLAGVANPATGETAGDTSQFEVQADWLKTADAFSGIFTIEIKGTKFEKVEFHLGK